MTRFALKNINKTDLELNGLKCTKKKQKRKRNCVRFTLIINYLQLQINLHYINNNNNDDIDDDHLVVDT